MTNRRNFIGSSLSSVFFTNSNVFGPNLRKDLLKPIALKIGGIIDMVCPAFTSK